jgi:mannose-6-phosphate isomerase-like protein (cupin superfamily)
VPRGTVHAFRNTGKEPAVSYAIYTPPFDGKDREPVQ